MLENVVFIPRVLDKNLPHHQPGTGRQVGTRRIVENRCAKRQDHHRRRGLHAARATRKTHLVVNFSRWGTVYFKVVGFHETGKADNSSLHVRLLVKDGS